MSNGISEQFTRINADEGAHGNLLIASEDTFKYANQQLHFIDKKGSCAAYPSLYAPSSGWKLELSGHVAQPSRQKKSISPSSHKNTRLVATNPIATLISASTQVIAFKHRIPWNLESSRLIIRKLQIRIRSDLSLVHQARTRLGPRIAYPFTRTADQILDIRRRHTLAMPHLIRVIKLPRRRRLLIHTILDLDRRRIRFVLDRVLQHHRLKQIPHAAHQLRVRRHIVDVILQRVWQVFGVITFLYKVVQVPSVLFPCYRW